MTKDYPICSMCKVKTNKGDYEGEYVCPNCARIYLPEKEIVEYEDTFVTSHSDEQVELEGISSGVGLLSAKDGQDDSLLDMLHKDPRCKPNMGEGAYHD
jgi:hypothetical protein